GGGCVQHGGVLNSAQPISGTEIGHTCGIDDSQGVRVCGDFVEIPQVASQCSRENAKLFGDRRNCQIPTYWRAPLITSYAEITVELYDPAPTGILLNVGNGFSISNIPTQSEGGYHHYNFAMPLDHPSMYIWGYEVNVTVWDSTNHYSYLEIEVDGLFSGVIDFLEGIWNGLCGVFSAVADAVAEAMSFLWDMMMSFYMAILSPLFEALNNTFNNFWAEFEVMIDELFVPHSPAEFIIDPEGSVNKFMNWFKLNSFMSWMIAIGLSIWIAEQAANVALPGIGTVIAVMAGSIWFCSLIKMLEFAGDRVITEQGSVPAYTAASSADQDAYGALDNSGQLWISILLAFSSKILLNKMPSSLVNAIGWAAMSMFVSVSKLMLDSSSPEAGILFVSISTFFWLQSTVEMIRSIATGAWTAPGTFILASMFWTGSFTNLFLAAGDLFY
ncbi:MAG: hypothetical protein KAS32_19015, partial [Candidatus Peribacteraceae bacterium]|nr:hypothetical protein [Candidatus Peribacteraceae bacterium]